ncbi:hypothetical protein [Laspinema palackyanum]|uniref:hypothetical protein n=1 Tax=Laspinema palackyanum TaxID=3231601 RepID=UPI00345D0525|nr:hypothetical protein [Laspinema sp. D2c]
MSLKSAPSDINLISQIVNYLQAVEAIHQSRPRNPDQSTFPSSEGLVLEYGCSFGECVPIGFQTLKKDSFQTCYERLLADPSLIYCEGYALAEGVSTPLIHSWLIGENGQVHDLTWKPVITGYFGIALESDFVKANVEKTGCYGILASDYLQDFFIHRHGFSNVSRHPKFHQS